jgi:hypothetical protein
MNIGPTIVRKKIEDVREAGATLVNAAASIETLTARSSHRVSTVNVRHQPQART